MEYENILLSINDNIAQITINRPSKLNALNKATIQELHHVLDALEKDTQVRVVILTGAGDKAFVAGADISEFASYSVEEGAQLAAQGQELLFNFIEKMKTPTIAAINGFALGGGLELAMACHFRVATNTAKMGLPEVSLGVIPGYGGTQRLPQLIGKGRAMELIMTAGMITADDAFRSGLVNHVFSPSVLMEETMEIAQRIAKNSPAAIGKAIKAINAGFKHDVDGYETEIRNFGKCFGTDDFKEGTNAFLEKRKPIFKGN